MALKKEIETSNGIITNYHRIMSINNITNKETQIIVYSYVSEEKREEEQSPVEEGQEQIFNVISSEMITKEYEEDFDIVKAYEYLKTLDKYKEAEDC